MEIWWASLRRQSDGVTLRLVAAMCTPTRLPVHMLEHLPSPMPMHLPILGNTLNAPRIHARTLPRPYALTLAHPTYAPMHTQHQYVCLVTHTRSQTQCEASRNLFIYLINKSIKYFL